MGQFFLDHQSVIFVYVVLFIIGVAYNVMVDWMENENLLGGKKAFLVCLGVAYTLALSVLFVPLRYIALIAGSFFFALLPLVWGDVRRYGKTVGHLKRFWQQIEEKKRNGHS